MKNLKLVAQHEIRNLLSGLALSIDLVESSNRQYIDSAKGSYRKLYIAFI